MVNCECNTTCLYDVVVFQYVQPSCVVVSAKQDEQLSKKLHEYSMSYWLPLFALLCSVTLLVTQGIIGMTV